MGRIVFEVVDEGDAACIRRVLCWVRILMWHTTLKLMQALKALADSSTLFRLGYRRRVKSP